MAKGHEHRQNTGASLPPAAHPVRFTAEEPDSLCPITNRGGHTWRVLYHLFRGLARWSLIWDSTPLPDVAHSWKASEDGRHYLFRLHRTSSGAMAHR